MFEQGASSSRFHRDLPFDRSTLEEMQPRLAVTRQLVIEKRVSINKRTGQAQVRSAEWHEAWAGSRAALRR